MKKATKEDLLKLKGGELIMVSIEDTYPDFAVFLNYDKETEEILCVDTLTKGIEDEHHYNFANYDECYIINTNQLLKTSKTILGVY